VTSSAAIRARVALFVLLSELVFVLAGSPSPARHPVHRATADAVTAHATSARLPKNSETKVRREGARDASCSIPAGVPIIARASWEHASFISTPQRPSFATTCEARARGPPVAA